MQIKPGLRNQSGIVKGLLHIEIQFQRGFKDQDGLDKLDKQEAGLSIVEGCYHFRHGGSLTSVPHTTFTGLNLPP